MGEKGRHVITTARLGHVHVRPRVHDKQNLPVETLLHSATNG